MYYHVLGTNQQYDEKKFTMPGCLFCMYVGWYNHRLGPGKMRINGGAGKYL